MARIVEVRVQMTGGAVGTDKQPEERAANPVPDQEPRAGDDRANAATEQAGAREAFYASFDRVIQDNVARSAEMLREAMDLREGAAREHAQAREAAEQRRGGDLAQQRALLSALLDDVIQLQGQAERLARRVADALDEIESDLPAGTFRSIAPDIPSPDLIATPRRASPDAASGDPGSGVQSAAGEDAAGAAEAPDAPPDILPTPTATREAPTEDASSDATAATDAPTSNVIDEKSAVVVLVHGVARPATARSLQRYLAGLNSVASVEPREFAMGVLRLHVTTTGPLGVEAFRDWPEGNGFEPVTTRADLIELRLPAGRDD